MQGTKNTCTRVRTYMRVRKFVLYPFTTYTVSFQNPKSINLSVSNKISFLQFQNFSERNDKADTVFAHELIFLKID